MPFAALVLYHFIREVFNWTRVPFFFRLLFLSNFEISIYTFTGIFKSSWKIRHAKQPEPGKEIKMLLSTDYTPGPFIFISRKFCCTNAISPNKFILYLLEPRCRIFPSWEFYTLFKLFKTSWVYFRPVVLNLGQLCALTSWGHLAMSANLFGHYWVGAGEETAIGI